MSVKIVRKYLEKYELADRVREFEVSSPSSAVKLNCSELEAASCAIGWIDVCKLREA